MPQTESALWDKYHKAAQKALEKGDLAQSEMQWLAAMEEAKDFETTDPRYALTFTGLSEVLSSQSKFSDAEPLLRHILQVCPEMEEKGATVYRLAVALEGQNKLLEAEKSYQQGMELLTKQKDPHSPELLDLMGRFADLLVRTHRQPEADHLRTCIEGMKTGNWSNPNPEPAQKKAPAAKSTPAAPATPRKNEAGTDQKGISVVKAAEKTVPNNTWLAYGKYATDAQSQGLYEVASSLWASALNEANNFLDSDPRLMATLDGYGETLTLLQRYDEAESYLNRCLELKERYLDHDDLSQAVTLNSLAKLHYFKGDIDKSVPFGLRCLHLYERAHGDCHLTVATTAYNLAIIYHRSNQFDLAEEMYRKSWDIRSNLLGDNNADTVKTMKNLMTLVLNRRGAEAGAKLDRTVNLGNISGTWKSMSIDEADQLRQ